MILELATIKARLGITDTQDDTLLTNFILWTGGKFQGFCNRKFERAVDATWEFAGDELHLRVDRFPIESVNSFDLKSNEATGWVAQTVSDYLINSTKSIIHLASPLGSAREIGRVTFTGGYVMPGGTPGAGQTALPDEIEQAAVEQVAYFYQNRSRLGIVSQGMDGGSITQFAQLDLLPSVKSSIRPFERLMM